MLIIFIQIQPDSNLILYNYLKIHPIILVYFKVHRLIFTMQHSLNFYYQIYLIVHLHYVKVSYLINQFPFSAIKYTLPFCLNPLLG